MNPILKILRAKQSVVANDQEYTLMRQIASELKMFGAAGWLVEPVPFTDSAGSQGDVSRANAANSLIP
jgi:hypothetical protein